MIDQIILFGIILNIFTIVLMFHLAYVFSQDPFVYMKMYQKSQSKSTLKVTLLLVQFLIELIIPFAYFLKYILILIEIKKNSHRSIREQYRAIERLEHKLSFFKFIKD